MRKFKFKEPQELAQSYKAGNCKSLEGEGK